MTDVLIPYSFVPGTKAMASEVNANFIALAKGIDECKTFTVQSLEEFNEDVETRLDEAIGNKLNFNLSNSVNITNSIVEIPQKIKLELNDGTLTLKAGSVVLIPNGADNFEEFVISADVAVGSPYTDGTIFIYYSKTNAGVDQANFSAQCSGASSSVAYGYWYDTNNNLVKRIDNNVVGSKVISFPLGVINASGGVWTSINQVFNGIGYIGSTIWVDKGVKVLIPNGRNEDGTLKNTGFKTDKVKTISATAGATYRANILLSQGGVYIPSITDLIYSGTDNYNKYSGNVNNSAIIGNASFSGGKVILFTPKTAFSAIDFYKALKQPKGFGTTVSISSGWMATCDGVIKMAGFSDSKGSTAYVYIDGVEVYATLQSGSNANHHTTSSIAPIYTGQVVTYSGTGFYNCDFYPYTY